MSSRERSENTILTNDYNPTGWQLTKRLLGHIDRKSVV